MAKKKAKKKEKGEQQELFELLGEHAGALKAAGKLYRKHLKARIEALAAEIAQKTIIRDLAAKAGLQRMPDGVIRFSVGDVEIEIEPRDDVVRVKEKKEVKVKPKD